MIIVKDTLKSIEEYNAARDKIEWIKASISYKQKEVEDLLNTLDTLEQLINNTSVKDLSNA